MLVVSSKCIKVSHTEICKVQLKKVYTAMA
jgi:hypothetical protein